MAIGDFFGNVASRVRNFFSRDDTPEITEGEQQQGPTALPDLPDELVNRVQERPTPEREEDPTPQTPQAQPEMPEWLKDVGNQQVEVSEGNGVNNAVEIGLGLINPRAAGARAFNRWIEPDTQEYDVDQNIKDIVEERSGLGVQADDAIRGADRAGFFDSPGRPSSVLGRATDALITARYPGLKPLSRRVTSNLEGDVNNRELIQGTRQAFDTRSPDDLRGAILENRIINQGGDPGLLLRSNVFKPFGDGNEVQATPYNIDPVINNFPLLRSADHSTENLVNSVNDAISNNPNEIDVDPYNFYLEMGGTLDEDTFRNQYAVERGYNIIEEKIQKDDERLREEAGISLGLSSQKAAKELSDMVWEGMEEGSINNVNAASLAVSEQNRISKDFATLEQFAKAANFTIQKRKIEGKDVSSLAEKRNDMATYISRVKDKMMKVARAQLNGDFSKQWLRDQIESQGFDMDLAYNEGVLMNAYLNLGTTANGILLSPEENLQLMSQDFNMRDIKNIWDGGLKNKIFATMVPASYGFTPVMIAFDEVVDHAFSIGREGIKTIGTGLSSRTLEEQANMTSDHQMMAFTSLSSISNNDQIAGYTAPKIPLKTFSMGFSDVSGNMLPFFIMAGALTSTAGKVSKAATSVKTLRKMGVGLKTANKISPRLNIGARAISSEYLIESSISRVDPEITTESSQDLAVWGMGAGVLVEWLGPALRLSVRRANGGWTAEKDIIDAAVEIRNTVGTAMPDGSTITDIDTSGMAGAIDLLKKANNAAKKDPEFNAYLKQKYFQGKTNQLLIDDAIKDGIITNSLKYEALRQGPDSDAWDKLISIIAGREASQQTQGIIQDIARYYGDKSKTFNDVIVDFEGITVGAQTRDLSTRQVESLSNRPTFLVKQSILSTMEEAGIDKTLRPGQEYTPQEMNKINKANTSGIGRKVDGDYANFQQLDNGNYILDPYKLGEDMGVQRTNVSANDFTDVLRTEEDAFNAMTEINRRKQASGGVYANPQRIIQSGAFDAVDNFLAKLVC